MISNLQRIIKYPFTQRVKWLQPLLFLLQLPIFPHRVFKQLRTKDYTWLGLLLYAFSGLVGLYVIYLEQEQAFAGLGAPQSQEYLPWIVLFHPIQGLTLATINDVTNFTQLVWHHYFTIFLVDFIAGILLAVIPAVTTQVLFQMIIPKRTLLTANLLIFSLSSIIFWPIINLPTVSRFINNNDLLILLPYVIGLLWIIYMAIALINIGELSFLKSLSLVIISIIFLPIMVVSAFINIAPFLGRPHKGKERRPPYAGIYLNPKDTFQQILARKPLFATLIHYGLIQIITPILVVAIIQYQLFDDLNNYITLAAFWGTLFHKFHLLHGIIILVFSPQQIGPQFGGESAQLLIWYLYPYFVIVPALTYVGFVAAIHLAIRRTMNAEGSFRCLLTSFLYILNASILFFIPYLLVFTWLIGSNPPSPLEEVAYVYFGTAYYAIFIWMAVLQMMAIHQIFTLPWERSAGSWFLSVILFFPVTIGILILETFSEIIRPFRVQIRLQELRGLSRQVLESKHRETALASIDRLLTLYIESTDIARRVRRKVDLVRVLNHLFTIDTRATLDIIVDLANHQEADIRSTASIALKIILDNAPDQAISSCYYLFSRNSRPQLFGHFREMADETEATNLVICYYNLLAETDSENLLTQLVQAQNLLRSWRDRPRGEETYLVYRALYALSQVTNIVMLQQSEIELIQALNVPNGYLKETARTLKPLLDISSNYLKYYGRAEFENKVPYLAAPIMILVDEDRRLEKISFPPEDGLLRLIIPRLQDVILREFDGLRGRADLHFELSPEQMPYETEVTFLLTIRNQGSAVAEKMQVKLLQGEDYGFTVASDPLIQLDLLAPKREARLEFTIQPDEPGRLRIPFVATYDDLERKDRQVPFASLLRLLAAGEEAAPAARETQLVNPYITGLPVKDPAMFFGRVDVFQFIKSHLQGQHEKNIIVLRGQRRTGKTSILYQLGYHLDEKYIPVFLDMQGFASTGIDRFLFWIARNITRAVIKSGYRVAMPRQTDFSDDPFGYFRQTYLPEILTTIEYHHLLLTFDEFEELAARVEDGKIDKDIFPYLRNLMQHQSRLDFIFAGTHKLQQITHEYWSILFNIALFRDIGFMHLEEVRQIIREPVKGIVFYDDLAIDKVFRITAGHPYFVQLIGNKLVDYYLKFNKFYLTLQDVNRVLDDVIMGGTLHFDYLWGDSSPIEQLILAAMARIIAREGGAASVAEISSLLERFGLNLSQSQILIAVRSLVTRELIITDADLRQFEFKIDLVRLWLDRYQRFGAVAEMFRENNLTTEPPVVAI